MNTTKKFIFILMAIFITAFTFGQSNLNAGYWVYPIRYEHASQAGGGAHVHYYVDCIILTGDAGIIKKTQCIYPPVGVGNQMLASKNIPDRKYKMNGKSYEVYDYGKVSIFHLGQEQLAYIY